MEWVMFKNMLVPISYDTLTKAEIKTVIKLAKSDSAKLTLVYVSDPIAPYSSSEIALPMISKNSLASVL